MLLGNAAGAALCLLLWVAAKYIVPNTSPVASVIYPSMLIAPFLIGVVAGLVWRPLRLRTGGIALHSFACMLLTLLGGWLFLHEGVVCLIMAFPILYVFIFVGALASTGAPSPDDRGKLNVFVLPVIVFLIALGEPATRRHVDGVVTDEILIHAPPEKVWPHVVDFPEIKEPPRYWLFRMGLPMPMATTCDGQYVGAGRRCIFNGGAVFEEKVSELAVNEKLTFDIVKSPPDPELLGHLELERGQFELRDNHDGTTTLIGRSWYSLNVRPVWYFDWWTHDVFRAVHVRVMEHIRTLSEARS